MIPILLWLSIIVACVLVQERSRTLSMQTQMRKVLLTLLCLQIVDAVLTYIAVSRFGVRAEANWIVSTVIRYYGTTTGIFLAKAAAIFIVVFILLRLERATSTQLLRLAKGVQYVYFAVLFTHFS